MAAKVGPASVSYGIGVQNRYSAFLDDEDGFALSNAVGNAKRAEVAAAVAAAATSNKQKGLATSTAKTSLAAKPNSRPVQPTTTMASTTTTKSQQPKGNQMDKSRAVDNRKPRLAPHQQTQQQHSANLNVQAQKHQANHRQGNNNQEYTANGNRSAIRPSHQPNINQHHQSNASQQHQQTRYQNNNEVNHQQGRFVKTNNSYQQQRFTNRRQFSNNNQNSNNSYEDKKSVQNFDDSSIAAQVGPQSIEEEKRRRQQKRALDLKHKDPEKREARRQQVALGEQQSQQTNELNPEQAQGESNFAFKGQQRNRRQPGERSNDENAPRGFQSGTRGRGRREQGGFESNETRDGQANRFPRGDRPQRNRNGFGAGSRGSRGSRGDEISKFGRDMDRQKSIPNFSDKLDFPSLAS